jgi:SAM-dependent methyltransferase
VTGLPEQAARWHPLGQALLDYHHGATRAVFTVHSDLWQDEPTPVEDYYRPDHVQLPEIERDALARCRGRVLDLGAGAGRHALELQRRGLAVTAVDVTSEAIEIMRERGVTDARCGDLDTVSGERFDTILLLMHGIGLVGTLDGLDDFLARVDLHFEHGGQIIFDSADLGIVLPDRFHEGLDHWRAGGRYPGEIEFRLSYKKLEGEPYPWLFVDPQTLGRHAENAGFRTEILRRGRRGSYLARLVGI